MVHACELQLVILEQSHRMKNCRSWILPNMIHTIALCFVLQALINDEQLTSNKSMTHTHTHATKGTRHLMKPIQTILEKTMQFLLTSPLLFGPKNIPKMFTTSKFHTTAVLTSGPAPKNNTTYRMPMQLQRSFRIFDPHGIFILVIWREKSWSSETWHGKWIAKRRSCRCHVLKKVTGTRGDAEGWNCRDCAGLRVCWKYP